MRCSLGLFFWLCLATSFSQAGSDATVMSLEGSPMPFSTHQAVRVVVSISPGFWQVVSAMQADTREPIHDAYILAPRDFKPIAEGRRMRVALINRQTLFSAIKAESPSTLSTASSLNPPIRTWQSRAGVRTSPAML